MRITHTMRHRAARRHIPAVCMTSIVIAFTPVPTVTVGQAPRSASAPEHGAYAVTVRLCVPLDRCGSLTAHVPATLIP
ncbi:MAG TPA: hypothetical protein VFN38_04435 [Gemmatimonadaceae bacterium]|nr:hypothetical protein [Gemmatimonadaceae bacterium]